MLVSRYSRRGSYSSSLLISPFEKLDGRRDYIKFILKKCLRKVPIDHINCDRVFGKTTSSVVTTHCCNLNQTLYPGVSYGVDDLWTCIACEQEHSGAKYVN